MTNTETARARRCQQHRWRVLFIPPNVNALTVWFGSPYYYPYDRYRKCMSCEAYGLYSKLTSKTRRLSEAEVKINDLVKMENYLYPPALINVAGEGGGE